MASFVLHIRTYSGHCGITHTHRLRMTDHLPAAWFIWQGASFRFPLSTLQRTSTVGRLVIIYTPTLLAKLCTSVYVASCSSWRMSLLRTGYNPWFEYISFDNPLNQLLIPLALCLFSQEMSIHHNIWNSHMMPIFVANYTHISGRWLPSHRQCGQLQYLPTWEWHTVRRNTAQSTLPDAIRCTWFRVCHGVIPTQYSLHHICLLSIDDCPRCPVHDTLLRTRLIVRRLKMSGIGLEKGWPLSYGPPRKTSLQNGWQHLRFHFSPNHHAVLWNLNNAIHYTFETR